MTAGAEVILVPELELKKEEIFQTIEENRAKGKRSGIIVAAEGVGDTRKLAKEIEEATGAEVRLTVLGYAQRGGTPTARSRLLGCLFGNKAVELLSEKQGSQIVGLQHGKITTLSLEETCKNEKPLDLTLLQLANVLAT
jgi:6-phosphofructokinase 1